MLRDASSVVLRDELALHILEAAAYIAQLVHQAKDDDQCAAVVNALIEDEAQAMDDFWTRVCKVYGAGPWRLRFVDARPVLTRSVSMLAKPEKWNGSCWN
ncbi:MAG: hypothetical protein NTW87_11885 [Planctomycetota bacterium]|nr:hypothetical protein [Planctomycetota bacterium]